MEFDNTRPDNGMMYSSDDVKYNPYTIGSPKDGSSTYRRKFYMGATPGAIAPEYIEKLYSSWTIGNYGQDNYRTWNHAFMGDPTDPGNAF
jgi:hypothetical protein